MAESGAVLPPILVHRASMRIIDGMHRLGAARLRGQERILVRYFAGGDEEAFLLAVKENVAHGLPLTLADRTAAAERIIRWQSGWSDRAIASVTGLSAKTIAAIRNRDDKDTAQSRARVGRDGRVRPLDASAGRRRAGELIVERPHASLREIAREAGVSPTTVRDVRERIRLGKDPVPTPQRESDSARGDKQADRIGPDPAAAAFMPRLRQDPSMRFNELGRKLLRLLDAHMADDEDWARLMDNVPPHCVDVVSALARACADKWQKCADKLEDRASISA